MLFDREVVKETKMGKIKSKLYDVIVWGVFAAIMYKIIFVEILHLNVFAMVK